MMQPQPQMIEVVGGQPQPQMIEVVGGQPQPQMIEVVGGQPQPQHMMQMVPQQQQGQQVVEIVTGPGGHPQQVQQGGHPQQFTQMLQPVARPPTTYQQLIEVVPNTQHGDPVNEIVEVYQAPPGDQQGYSPGNQQVNVIEIVAPTG